jgi:Transposase DDE domain
VVKNDDGTRSRGYKLATLRTLLDSAGLLTQVAMSAIQVHDMALCRPLLEEAPMLRAGDLLLEDRGFIDGATLSHLKRQRQVDVIIPLKANMLATQEAMQLAEMANKWQAHPSRTDQRIALVRGVEHMWAECEVPLNACVIRFWNKKKKRTDHIVLVTTDLELSASWIVRHYEERPEIEQDYEQMKSGGWQLKKLSSTRYSEIVFYVLTVVLSYSLYHLFANTQAGTRFADKTRQALAFEQLRTQRTHIIVYAGGYFGRVDREVAHPGPSQIRTCPTQASGSSKPQICYVPTAGRMIFARGSGYCSSRRAKRSQRMLRRWERRFSHFRQRRMTSHCTRRSRCALPVIP